MPPSPSIDELNRRFAISGAASITAGNQGLPRVSVLTPVAAAEIYLHGAQLTSWRPVGGGPGDPRRHPRLFPLVS